MSGQLLVSTTLRWSCLVMGILTVLTTPVITPDFHPMEGLDLEVERLVTFEVFWTNLLILGHHTMLRACWEEVG